MAIAAMAEQGATASKVVRLGRRGMAEFEKAFVLVTYTGRTSGGRQYQVETAMHYGHEGGI